MERRTAAITVRNSKGIARKEKLKSLSCELLLKDLLATLWSGETRSIASAADIDAVGHRVVHGGPHFHDPIRISNDVTRLSPDSHSLLRCTFNRNSKG